MFDFFRLINLPCRDMTRLISAAQDRSLSSPERFAVKLHLLYCTSCRRFKHHTQLLRNALRRLVASEIPTDSGPGLSPKARERIRKSLQEHQ